MLKNKYYILTIISLLFLILSPYSAQGSSQIPNDLNKAKNSAESVLGLIPGLYKQYLRPWVRLGIDKGWYYLNKEVERRKPGAEQELKKELNEMKNEIPSFWNKIKNFLY